jgi:hypothetical protein
VDGIKMFKKILLASVLLASTTVASNAAVLWSDDFSSSAQGLNATPNGWVVDYGTVDVIGPGFYDFYPGNNNYIDTNGSNSQSGGMHTNTVFNFLAGKTYTISFDYGNNKGSDFNGSVETLVLDLIGFGGTVINHTGPIASFINYVFSFTPGSNFNSAIYFNASGTNDGDNGGLILDNVSLSVVPVPAALPLLAAGLGVLGFASRRRKAKSAA